MDIKEQINQLNYTKVYMSDLIYEKITWEKDRDIPLIEKMYLIPKISRYLSISDNFFSYVTTTPDVYFYKAYLNNKLIGVTHIEKQGELLYMSILVFPEFQRMGLGTKIIKDIQADIFNLGYERIQVSIAESNIPSVRLFEKAGFVRMSKEDDLINFAYDKENNTMKNNKEPQKIQYMPIYMCLGISVGMAIGVALDNIGVGMCLGAGFGMCIGSIIDANNNKKTDDSKPEEKDEE